jgi:hypothetical protein
MADLTGRTIIKGIGGMEYGGQAALADRSGVPRQRLNELLCGREGISLPACKALASALSPRPNAHAVFVEGRANALKRNDATPAETLSAVALVLKTLAADSENVVASPEFDAACESLHRVGEAALASVKRGGVVSVSGTLGKLGRDGSGLSAKKRQDEPSAAAKKKTKRPARNGDGTSNRKLAT